MHTRYPKNTTSGPPDLQAQHEVFRFTAADHGGLSLEAMIVAVMSVFFAFGAPVSIVFMDNNTNFLRVCPAACMEGCCSSDALAPC